MPEKDDPPPEKTLHIRNDPNTRKLELEQAIQLKYEEQKQILDEQYQRAVRKLEIQLQKELLQVPIQVLEEEEAELDRQEAGQPPPSLQQISNENGTVLQRRRPVSLTDKSGGKLQL